MAPDAPAPTQTTSPVSTRTKPAIHSTLVPAAVLLAVVVAVLSLLPSVAQAVWEVPHLLLLGLVISYGVFAQKNASVSASDGDGDASKDGARAWNSRYQPDEPLVVVADHAGSDGEDGVTAEMPFSLPVRRLKPVVEEPETGGGGDTDNGIGDDTDSSASTEGFWAGSLAAPLPPSVLNTFDSRGFNAATLSTTPKGGFGGYDSNLAPCVDQQSLNDGDDGDEEDTDWDEECDGSDKMTASSEMSFPGDFVPCVNRGNDAYSCDGESVVDEELLDLATKAEPEGEEEVDRKADEFIAKFREQIRLQRCSRP